MPDSVADLVAGLPPEGAGAVRDLTDHLAVLGEMLEDSESGEVTVPASDISSLRALAPDLVQEVWLTSGAIVIATNDPDIGSILVKPLRGEDGLIEVRLNRLWLLEYHPMVRVLVGALNGYVVDHGGRFSEVTVTPEGLIVTAERTTPEEGSRRGGWAYVEAATTM